MSKITKKDYGIAVTALAEYASDCWGNGELIEMKQTFEIAINMANMHELREEEWVKNLYRNYMSGITHELKEEIKRGETARKIAKDLGII